MGPAPIHMEQINITGNTRFIEWLLPHKMRNHNQSNGIAVSMSLNRKRNCISQAASPKTMEMQQVENPNRYAFKNAKIGSNNGIDKNAATPVTIKGKIYARTTPTIDMRQFIAASIKEKTSALEWNAAQAPSRSPATQESPRRNKREPEERQNTSEQLRFCANQKPPNRTIGIGGTAHITYKEKTSLNILHHYYTPNPPKTQVNLDITTFFVNYAHNYVNIVMSTFETKVLHLLAI